MVERSGLFLLFISDNGYVFQEDHGLLCTGQLTGNRRSKEPANGFAKYKTSRVKGCIHHSDRGIQYCCDTYTALLIKNGFTISMTEQSDPLENAIAERVNKTIKEEFTDQKEISFTTITTAKKSIKQFIDFYNNQRPHRSIDWLTPSQAYQREGELKRHWKMYIKKEKGDL